MEKIILTKNTEISEVDSSDDLTGRTLLGYSFSDVAVSLTERKKIGLLKRAIQGAATEILISLLTRFVAVPP